MELVEEDAGLGSMGLGRGSKRLPHVHDSHSNTLAFPGPQPLEELVHARLGAILAAKPDGPPSYQVTHDDPVGVPLPGRDLVDADHFRSWRPGSSELLLHVLLLECLDRVPVQMQLLSNILDRRGSASTTDVEAKALGVERLSARKSSFSCFTLPQRTQSTRRIRDPETLGCCRMTSLVPGVSSDRRSCDPPCRTLRTLFFERRCSVTTRA